MNVFVCSSNKFFFKQILVEGFPSKTFRGYSIKKQFEKFEYCVSWEAIFYLVSEMETIVLGVRVVLQVRSNLYTNGEKFLNTYFIVYREMKNDTCIIICQLN